MTDHLIPMALAFWFVAVAFGLGDLVIRRLGFGSVSEDYFYIPSFAVGLAILSHLLLLFGLCGWYRMSAAVLLLIVLTLLSSRRLGTVILSAKALGKSLRPLSRWETVFLAVSAVFAVLTVFASLVPPYGGDALVYHLAAPKFFIEQGGMSFVPVLPYNMPLGIEMIYLLSMLLQGPKAGLLINAFLGVLTAVVFYRFGTKIHTKLSGLLAAAIFYSIPSGVWYLSFIGKTNLGLFLYVSLGFVFLYEWMEKPQRSSLLLAAFFAGFAASIKYTGLYAVCASLPVLVVILLRRPRNHAPFAQDILLYLLALMLGGAPWYLKNWLLLGNPVWPVAYSLFGGRGLTDGLYRQLINIGYPSLGHGLWSWLTGPWHLNREMEVFFLKGGIGPLFLAFLPLIIFFRDIRRKNRLILSYAAIFYSCWFLFVHDGMYLLPAVLLLVFPVSQVIAQLATGRYFMPRAAALALTVVWLAGSAAILVQRSWHMAPVILARESKDDFLMRTAGFYDVFRWINRNLPADAVLYAQTKSVYYLDRRYVKDGEGYIDLPAVKTDQELLDELRKWHVTHVLQVKSDPQAGHSVLDQLLSRHGKLLYARDHYAVPLSIVFNQSRELAIFLYEVDYPES